MQELCVLVCRDQDESGDQGNPDFDPGTGGFYGAGYVFVHGPAVLPVPYPGGHRTAHRFLIMKDQPIQRKAARDLKRNRPSLFTGLVINRPVFFQISPPHILKYIIDSEPKIVEPFFHSARGNSEVWIPLDDFVHLHKNFFGFPRKLPVQAF